MDSERLGLLDVIAEELRLPLMRVQLLAQTENRNEDIKVLSRDLIELLDALQDSYNQSNQSRLELEPVNPAQLCDEVSHDIYAYANLHDVRVLSKNLNKQPVLANYSILKSGFKHMSLALVDLIKNYDKSKREIYLNADTTELGTRLGVYAAHTDFDAADLRNLRKLFLKTTRPIARQTNAPTMRLFIADKSLAHMGFKMRTAINSRERGLAVVLPLSSQLNLF